ncbi:hypothetical protein ACTHPH_07685 [Paenibacillus pasadenensis]|uniref:hypothetical protein n=1 Tax=Paenibacillus TaxID=44249 RepID=UPI00040921B8|nr:MULTISPECIES: hypothetical protein [Paenibacillus]QGG57361.1 hypothetical protein GE073_18350 [Paenibacillus sp. B01]
MRKIAALYSGLSYQNRAWNEPKYRKYIADIVYVPDMGPESLAGFDVVLLPSRLHTGLLMKLKPLLDSFAAQGGTVVVFWPNDAEQIVPNQNWEDRPTNFWWWLDKNAKSGIEQRNPGHDLYNYITLQDATWHYHGVFWPQGDVVPLVETEDGGAILYVDKSSTAGTWVVTSLDPEFHYGSYFMPATERFLDGFLPWLAEGEL